MNIFFDKDSTSENNNEPPYFMRSRIIFGGPIIVDGVTYTETVDLSESDDESDP